MKQCHKFTQDKILAELRMGVDLSDKYFSAVCAAAGFVNCCCEAFRENMRAV